MMRPLVRVKVVVCLLLGALPAMAAQPPAAPDKQDSIGDESTLGAPLLASNVAVFPLVAKNPPPPSAYLTLDEAFDDKVLTVRETDASGNVPALHVDNKSDIPIYAMSGELLLGGKQDRIVARNVLIPKRADNFAVAVFCVEQGRWQARRGLKFKSSKRLAHTKLRQVTNAESQGEVWAEVAKTNRKRKTVNRTSTYRAAVAKNVSSKQLEADFKKLDAGLRAMPKVAGMVVAINGKPRAVDWFSDPALYRKLQEKLLRSFLAEAADMNDGKKHDPPKLSDVKKFIENAEKAPVKAARKSGKAKFYSFSDAAFDGQMAVPEAKKGEKRKPKAIQKSFYAK